MFIMVVRDGKANSRRPRGVVSGTAVTGVLANVV